jgi:hypothetical protein
MILLEVDEAYAFDFLSILEVKKNKSGNRKNYEICKGYLRKQIDGNLFDSILNSDVYRDLVNVNLAIFDCVDEVKKNPCIGLQIDSLNYLN